MNNTRQKELAGVDLLKLREYVDEYGGDGWTIWKPEKFTEMGFKASKLPVKTHQSGTGKYAITNSETGKIGDLKGVWNLDMLFRLAGIFDVKFAGYMGRGFQARAIRDAVLPKLDELISTAKGTK